MRCNKHFNIKRLGLLRSLELLTGFGIALVALLGAMLMAIPTHAEQSTIDTVNVTLQTSCTISGTINTPHTATVVPGVYTQGIGQTTIKAICNDINGFSLYAAGFTDNTVGKTVLASETSSTYDIPTGTATSGTSNWAMKVNSVSGTTAPTIYGSFDDYHSVPSSYTKVAGYGGATDPTDGSSVTTTYALYTTPTQLTGTYSGQVRYVIVHPSTANGYTIVYNANGGTVSPASEVVPLGTSITLPTPTQSGYSFLGWYTAPTGGEKIGDGGDTYSPTENVALHAQWEELMTFDKAFAAAGKTKSGDYYAMLDMTSAICDAVDEGQEGILVDTRDNNTYNVGKLADGKCWMLDNLAFNGKNNKGSGGYITMNSSNTNINTTKTWNDTIRTGWTSSSQNVYDASYINDASKDVVPSDATSRAGQYRVGVYYNYCAATLDTICSSDTTTVASYDVCPKGWKLPAGNTSGDFSALAQAIYGSTGSTSDPTAIANYRAALHLPLSGYFYSGSPGNQGSYGRWWSTTANNSTFRDYLDVDTSGIDPTSNVTRKYGISIRCISQ